MPRLKYEGRLLAARGVLALSLESWPCPRQGASRRSVTRRHRVSHISFRERAARASLACRESWRGHGYALGFMAATF